MRDRDSWQLLSIGEIALEKVHKNLRELSSFMSASGEVIKTIFLSYHPLVIVDAITAEALDANLSEQEKIQRSALLSFLATLLPYSRTDHPSYEEMPAKEYRRLLQSFDELERKAVRFVDNTALRLRAEGTIDSDRVMLAYQQEALAFLACRDEVFEQERYRSLQYRLQPFNALIAEVFPAKLDALLSSFKTLAERNVAVRSDWEVVGNTALSEADAHLLSCDMGRLGWDEATYRLIDRRAVASHPFSRLRSTYYCLDGKRLLREGYAVIKEAVCRQGEEYASRWEQIEASKCRLMPITFFTAMFSTMDWQRDWPYGGSVVDALFERNDEQVLIQIPWAEHSIRPINPIAEPEDAVRRIGDALAKVDLLRRAAKPAIVVDCRDRTPYPLVSDGTILTLSFFQLAAIGTTWEGVALIKEQLGLGPKIAAADDEVEEEDEEGEDESYPAVGSSYFTSMFHDPPPHDDDEDEETADEMLDAVEQPSLFDFDDEDLFSYDRHRPDDDDDDDEEYESEAYCIIEPQQLADEPKVSNEGLAIADEEMESGSLDRDITFYGPSEDEDDADELLDMIKQPQPPIGRFILADAVSKAARAKASAAQTESVRPEPAGGSTRPLDPTLPPVIAQIMAQLPNAEGSVFAHFVSEQETALLEETVTLIEKAKEAQRLDGRDKMFSVPGIDLTIVVASSRGDAMSAWNRRNSVGAMMYLQKKPFWHMVYLEYDKSGTLVAVDEQTISAKEFSASDWKYVANLAERMMERKRR